MFSYNTVWHNLKKPMRKLNIENRYLTVIVKYLTVVNFLTRVSIFFVNELKMDLFFVCVIVMGFLVFRMSMIMSLPNVAYQIPKFVMGFG